MQEDFRAWEPLQGEETWLSNPAFPGFAFQNRANEVLVEALSDWSGEAPADSILVEHRWNPERQRFGLHALWKVPGHAPEAGDWYWLHVRHDDDAQHYARAVPHDEPAECTRCHAAGQDYLLGAAW